MLTGELCCAWLRLQLPSAHRDLGLLQSSRLVQGKSLQRAEPVLLPHSLHSLHWANLFCVTCRLPREIEQCQTNPEQNEASSPQVTQPHPLLLREYPAVCFTKAIRGVVVCGDLLKHNTCAFLWPIWIKLPLQLVTAAPR